MTFTIYDEIFYSEIDKSYFKLNNFFTLFYDKMTLI